MTFKSFLLLAIMQKKISTLNPREYDTVMGSTVGNFNMNIFP